MVGYSRLVTPRFCVWDLLSHKSGSLAPTHMSQCSHWNVGLIFSSICINMVDYSTLSTVSRVSDSFTPPYVRKLKSNTHDTVSTLEHLIGIFIYLSHIWRLFCYFSKQSFWVLLSKYLEDSVYTSLKQLYVWLNVLESFLRECNNLRSILRITGSWVATRSRQWAKGQLLIDCPMSHGRQPMANTICG